MVIFIQETMMEAEKAKEILESWLKGWNFEDISLEGHSRGIITSWNQEYDKVQEEKHSLALKTILKEKAMGNSYALYNVYRPYQYRKGFWEILFSSGILEPANVILGGDLNLTLSKKN